MKLEKPPQIEQNPSYFLKILAGEYADFLSKSDSKYYYWDDLKYRKDAPFDSAIENWTLLKAYRKSKYNAIKFGNYTFYYYLFDGVLKQLHEFDLKLMGGLKQNPILPSDRLEYFKNSLLEEAVASSQVEGAATTTEVARDMLKSGRQPRNESEQMIFNNLRAIEFMNEYTANNLDFKLIIDLHKIMTANTQAEKYSGNFRQGEVYITDHVDGEIAHIPPDWQEVSTLMGQLCDFVNDEKKFIHPIIKASIIHFMIGFIHPFIDGNGRTARALFYWYLIKKEYALIRNISISRVILESRTQYDKAFLKTEYDENDLNYFLAYSIKNIRIAFEKLLNYRDKKSEERKEANLIAYDLLQKGLNKRQADLVGYLYNKPQQFMILNTYVKKHKIVRQTASKDFNELIIMGLLVEDKKSKPFKYTVPSKKAIEDYLNKNAG